LMGSGMRVVMIATPKARGLGRVILTFALAWSTQPPSSTSARVGGWPKPGAAHYLIRRACDSGHCFWIIMPHQVIWDWLPETNLH
jgi:hypothetical protein